MASLHDCLFVRKADFKIRLHFCSCTLAHAPVTSPAALLMASIFSHAYHDADEDDDNDDGDDSDDDENDVGEDNDDDAASVVSNV